MGKTVETVKIQNFGDIMAATQGLRDLPAREAEVEAVVDTGAAFLSLPPDVVKELGLVYTHSQRVVTANGEVERRFFGGARIEIRDRNIQMEVMENDRTTPALIGFLVLEALDFIVDPTGQTLLPNPEHHGKWLVELY